MNRKTYQEAKQRHPNMLLLFRVGDGYELYGQDAETAAKLLGVTLTTRKERGETVAMTGFPHNSLERSLQSLLRAGHRVAVCDQVDETPTTQPAERLLF